MEFLRHTLDNGLEVLAERNGRAYSTAIGYFVKTGARDESPEISGVSHFLEHMMFKGSQHRTAEQLNRELDEIGSHSNAFTSEEQTVYHAVLLPEYLDRAVELLSDMMRPALREEDFEVEKKVILEEIAKYDDEPPFGAYEKAMAVHFANQSLGRSVLGTRETIHALRIEQMRAFFERQYSPNNMALVATGNVDFDQLVRLADKYPGGWPPFTPQRDPTRGCRVPSRCASGVIVHPLARQQYVILVSDAPAAEAPERFAARLLSTIVGDDTGSRFFWELVDTGRAECAVAGLHQFQGTGVMLTYLCCPPERTAENVSILRRIWDDVWQHGVREDELERVKNKVCAQLVMASERAANRLFAVGSNWLTRGEYRTVRELMEAYRAVTRDDIQRVLERYPPRPCSACAVGPRGDLDLADWTTGLTATHNAGVS